MIEGTYIHTLNTSNAPDHQLVYTMECIREVKSFIMVNLPVIILSLYGICHIVMMQ